MMVRNMCTVYVTQACSNVTNERERERERERETYTYDK